MTPWTRWSPALAMVGLALLFSARPAPVRGSEPAPADLVLLHGRVEAPGRPEALAIRDGRILALGTDAEIRALAGPRTRVVDAGGGSVLPGFVDSHVHLMSGGMGLRGIPLQGLTTRSQIQERVREAAARTPGDGWLVGRGWTYDAFGGGLPTRQMLDAVVPDRPVYLRCFDGHTGWANSAALQRAGLTARTPDPPGGSLVRDPATGELTGVVKESAEDLVRRAIPAPTPSEEEEGLRAGVLEAWRVGVTAVGEAGATFDEFRVFERLRERGELGLRTTVAMQLEDPTSEAELARADALRQRYREDPFLRVPAVKLFIDGVIESRTARLLQPYAGVQGRGEPLMDQATLDRVVAGLVKRGWQVWVHAIGDGGVRMVLDALERAGDPETIRAGRHRLEHAELVDPADMPRLARLGVVASQQPLHGSPDAIHTWRQNLGAPREGRGWAHHSLLAAGARLALGTDWPVVGLDPLPNLQVAVTREASGLSWSPEERLSLDAALEACTAGGAWASFNEERFGSLAVGRLADVVVLSRDLRALGDLREARVAVTVVDGQVVHEEGTGR